MVLTALVLVVGLAALAPAQDSQADRGPSPTTGKPTLVVDELTHNFGEVRPGKALRWVFKIKNTGNADLLIHSVAPG